jgi:hypothetical protein
MSDKINKILNIVIVILTVIIFCLSLYLLEQTKPRIGNHKPETAESMLRRLERGNYNGLVETKYLNEMDGATAAADSSYKVPYAATDYYEAALLYNAHVRTGENDKALKYKEVMDESRKTLGDYSYLADDIDSFLGI